MSDTNLPPNIESGLNDAASKLGDFNSELGQQVKLARNFNKQIGAVLDNIKKSNDTFGKLKSPLENLKKSIDALSKVVQANTKTMYYGFSRSFRASGFGDRLRRIMSDSRLPPDPPDGGGNVDREPEGEPWYKKFIESFENSFEKITRDNIESMKGVINSNIKYFNITDNLVKSFRNFEALQLKSLGMGIDYNKFLEENSEALDNSRVGQQQLREVMISNFAAGIKMNSAELQNLNEEMIATGQDTQSLQTVNANLLALTGKNTSVVSNLARVNKEVSDEYQISNDRLVKTMQSLSENLEQASFFGPQAVESVGRLGQELQGVLGVDMPREINTVLSLIQPSIDNLGKQSLLGLEALPQAFVDGTPQLSDLEPMFKRVLGVISRAQASNITTANQVAADQLQLSQSQLRAIQRVAEGVINGNAMQSSLEKKQEEEFKSVKNLRERQLDYFTVAGPGTYEVIQQHTQLLNNISLGINALGLAAGVTKFSGGFDSSKGSRLGRAGLRGVGGLAAGLAAGAMTYQSGTTGLGGAAGSVAGGAIGQILIPIPGLGAAIGTAVGGYLGDKLESLTNSSDQIVNNTEAQAKAAEAERLEKERKRREEAAANIKANNTIESLATYINRVIDRQNTRNEDVLQLGREIKSELIKTRTALSRSSGGLPE